jgi:hypothetical protein
MNRLSNQSKLFGVTEATGMGWLPDPNAAAAHGLWKDPEIDEAVKSQKPDGSAKR